MEARPADVVKEVRSLPDLFLLLIIHQRGVISSMDALVRYYYGRVYGWGRLNLYGYLRRLEARGLVKVREVRRAYGSGYRIEVRLTKEGKALAETVVQVIRNIISG